MNPKEYIESHMYTALSSLASPQASVKNDASIYVGIVGEGMRTDWEKFVDHNPNGQGSICVSTAG